MPQLSQNQKNIALTALITAIIVAELFYIISLKKEIKNLEQNQNYLEVPNFENIISE